MQRSNGRSVLLEFRRLRVQFPSWAQKVSDVTKMFGKQIVNIKGETDKQRY